MNYSISAELQFFIVSIISGAILLVVYDILRILRRVIKHGKFLVAVQDLIFWICASVFIFLMMYKENNGVIRGFCIIGMAIGSILYHYTLSTVFVDLVTKLIKALISPIAYVVKRIIKYGKLVLNKGKIVINYLNKRLKKRLESVRIKVSAKHQATKNKRKMHLEKKIAARNKAKELKDAKRKANRKEKNKIDGDKAVRDSQQTVQSGSGNRRVVKVYPVPIKTRDKG